MTVALTWVVGAALLCSPLVAAEGLKVGNREDALKSAGLIAGDLMGLYNGDDSSGVPGLLPEPYYWYQGGLFMSSFIDYWRWSGDSKFNDAVSEGMLFQVGEDKNFMPVNQTRTMGNDEQCVWALSAMLAAEYDFPKPSGDRPQWLELAKNVFNDQVLRIDDKACDGGLRWQVFSFNNGYNYKNSISNGCFFDLGARLAKHTGDSKYAKASEGIWGWVNTVGLVNNKTWSVYDGAHTENDCSEISNYEFSYNAAIFAHGAAYMYNNTNGDSTWRERTLKFTDSILKKFFPDGVAIEAACETKEVCNIDQIAMKGMTLRLLASIARIAPFTSEKINAALQKTGEAAAEHCSGGKSGRQCGTYWEGKFVEPKSSGFGEQMNALAAVTNLLAASSTDKDVPADNKPSGNGSSSDSTETSSATPAASSAPAETSLPAGSGTHLTISGALAFVVASGVVLMGL